jgi:predicted SnoaL-like aldol condensation-catalyzing enzyme
VSVMGRSYRWMMVCAVFPVFLGAAGGTVTHTPDNRTIVTRFAELFYGKKDVEAAFRAHVAPNYTQHNPGIADGREAAIAALKPLFAREDHRFSVERILVDGELAAVHVRVTSPTPPGTHGAAVVDIYRLAGGKIVEHWDVIQLVPDKSENTHPMF